jgi:hypothetical protein
MQKPKKFGKNIENKIQMHIEFDVVNLVFLNI